MATKTELETELTELKREMAQQRAQPVASPSSAEYVADVAEEAHETSDTAKLKSLLEEKGVPVESIETMGSELIEELSELQKEKPIVVLLLTFALGCLVGRTLK